MKEFLRASFDPARGRSKADGRCEIFGLERCQIRRGHSPDQTSPRRRDEEKEAADDSARFTSSKQLGAYFGLTPSKYQSGTIDVTGSITKASDAMVHSVLYEVAHSMLTRVKSNFRLKRWAMAVAKRRGLRHATVALARKSSRSFCAAYG